MARRMAGEPLREAMQGTPRSSSGLAACQPRPLKGQPGNCCLWTTFSSLVLLDLALRGARPAAERRKAEHHLGVSSRSNVPRGPPETCLQAALSGARVPAGSLPRPHHRMRLHPRKQEPREAGPSGGRRASWRDAPSARLPLPVGERGPLGPPGRPQRPVLNLTDFTLRRSPRKQPRGCGIAVTSEGECPHGQ